MSAVALAKEDENGQPASRDLLLARMRERARYLAQSLQGPDARLGCGQRGHYDNGTLRDSKWTQIIGNDFIEQAFRIAQEELPVDVALLSEFATSSLS